MDSESSSTVKQCQLCVTKAPDLKHLLKHIRQVHAHQPGFKLCCGLSGCPRMFTTFEVFRNHVYAVHTDDEVISIPMPEEHPTEEINDPLLDDDNDLSAGQSVRQSRKKAAAIWILKIQEVYKLPQSTMENILTDVTGFIEDMLTELYEDVVSFLAEAGVEVSSVAGLSDLFRSHANPFAGLQTQFTQLKFYIDALNLVVSVQ